MCLYRSTTMHNLPASMAVSRRTSAAYATLVAITSMRSTSRGSKHSKRSISTHSADDNIINGPTQNHNNDFGRDNKTYEVVHQVPTILVEDNQDTNQRISCDKIINLPRSSDIYSNHVLLSLYQ